MHCFCCNSKIEIARKAKVRRCVEYTPTRTEVGDWSEFTPQELAAYTAYREQMTYRWAVICHPCYRRVDNDRGAAQIGNAYFNIAGVSRRDKATVMDERKYRAWQEREARKLGL